MESGDDKVEGTLRAEGVNPSTVMAEHFRSENLLETVKRMMTSKNAKIATNSNFYPIGNY